MDFSSQIIKHQRREKITGQGMIKQKKSYRKYIYAVLIFAVCLLLLFSCVNDSFFDSDEGEIYSKGTAIAHGELLYRDFASQHMPVMYYIAALFNLLGASKVYEFRILFYILFSLIWGLCAIWYDGKIPTIALVFCPVLYISMISRVEFGTSILSEHAQTIGINILIYELICYYYNEKISTGQLIRISFAVFLSFGAAFTTVFPVFFLVLTIVAIDIDRFFLRKTAHSRISVKELIRRYSLITLAVAAPFIALCIFYIFTGSMDDFYYWAYKFNISIYSNYQPTGGDILQSMFCGFDNVLVPIISEWNDSTSMLFAEFTALGLLSIVASGVIMRTSIVPIGLLLMLNGCETRGTIFGFHSMHAIMLQCVVIGYVASVIISNIQLERVKPLVIAGVFTVVLLPFRGHLYHIPDTLVPIDPTDYSLSRCVDILTDEGDKIGNSTLAESIYIESQTVPASIVSASVKWMWDGAGKKAMEQLRADPPRVYILDEGYNVWGYPLKEYAPELIAFVHENYTSMEAYGLPTVYVLNSYYEKACALLDERDDFYKIYTTVDVDKENATVSISFDTSKECNNIYAAIWSEVRDQDDLVWYAPDTENKPFIFKIDLRDHKTLGRYFVHFYEDRKKGDRTFLKGIEFTVDSLPDSIECITE